MTFNGPTTSFVWKRSDRWPGDQRCISGSFRTKALLEPQPRESRGVTRTCDQRTTVGGIKCFPHNPCLRDASRRSLATNTFGDTGTKVAQVKVLARKACSCRKSEKGVGTKECANIESSPPRKRDERHCSYILPRKAGASSRKRRRSSAAAMAAWSESASDNWCHENYVKGCRWRGGEVATAADFDRWKTARVVVWDSTPAGARARQV